MNLRPLLVLPIVAAGVALTTPAFASHTPTAKTYIVNEVVGSGPSSNKSGFAFKPYTLTVHKGDSVSFVDKSGSVPHNVVGMGNKVINRKAVNTQTYKLTFTKAGTYKYVCQIHPGMIGTVVVK